MNIYLIETSNSIQPSEKTALATLIQKLGIKPTIIESCSKTPTSVLKESVFVTHEGYSFHIENVRHHLKKAAEYSNMTFIHIKLKN